jgi:hypothetical protein
LRAATAPSSSLIFSVTSASGSKVLPSASGPRCLSTLAIFPSSARGGRDLLDHVMIVSTSARRLTAQITTGWWSDVGTPVLHADGLRTRWWRFGTINVDAPRLNLPFSRLERG